MRRLITLFALALPLAAFSAPGGGGWLTVTRQGGSEVSYAIDRFRVTYTPVAMCVESAGETFTLPLADLVSMRLTKSPTSVTSPEARPALALDGQGGIVAGAAKAVRLRVFSADGAEALSVVVPAGGGRADISALPKGVYVVTAGSVSLKFEKR